ncbi:hypothetical protein [Escherichia coli]|uniref:hypothetical protein n=1 Tax=Escherichia coli TaxID=562 RepID=UPI003B596687
MGKDENIIVEDVFHQNYGPGMAFRLIGAASFIVMDLLIMNTSALRVRHTISPLNMDTNHSKAA